MFKPTLLLLDEPLAALDKQLRESMQLELKRIQREVGVTTVAVTHDQVEALTMSNHVGILHEGRVEQFGTPEQLYRQPATEFVARFLGEANLLRVDPGGRLEGLKVKLDRVGAGTAVVRPEQLTVRRDSAATSPVAGTVEEMSFQGSRYRGVVRINDEMRLIAAIAPGEREAAIRIGDRVGVAYDVASVHVIGNVPQGTGDDGGLLFERRGREPHAPDGSLTR